MKTLDQFVLQSETERKYDQFHQTTYLQDIWVGNFDSMDDKGNYDPRPQIETFEYTLNPTNFAYTSHINIFNVDVPLPATPVNGIPGNWLNQKSDNTANLPTYGFGFTTEPVGTDLYAPGDFQGRSLRLGSPSVVRIKTQIQPDLVLAVPPMHVDWIPTHSTSLLDKNVNPMCIDTQTPCITNLTALPISPAENQPSFSTLFQYATTSTQSASQASTTSWGVSVASTVEGSVSVGDGIQSGTLDVKNTAKYAHDNVVKKTFTEAVAQTGTFTALTGLADILLYTILSQNVYYYPVLGVEGCEKGRSDSQCTVDGKPTPLYVHFSVPDNVTKSAGDGTSIDWYQPTHEPFNVLSYPWNVAELQAGFHDIVTPLTTQPTCLVTDTSTQTKGTQWTGSKAISKSVGVTNTFSDESSISTSYKAGISGALSGSASFSLDIGASTSLNTLTENMTSLSESMGINLSKPPFLDVNTCCTYSYGQYIYGLANNNHPPSDTLCIGMQTPEKDGCLAVEVPYEKKQVDLSGPGPIFTAYFADPLSTPADYLACGGQYSAWWQGQYTKPDIAVNHPGRWSWSKDNQLISFVAPSTKPSQNETVGDPFYAMKGFFITKQGNTTGPNLAEATAGDKLLLTARVHNFSLVDTTAPVRVRIYGQFFCSTGSANEASCNSGTAAPCPIGLLCGNGFLIGDKSIDSISGFKSNGDVPNWKTVSVNFDTTKYANVNMVFWVVAWMEDSAGRLGAEMPGHGLTANPASLTLRQITDVPVEPYSNNVGLYGAHQRFYISPAGTSLGATDSEGALKSISLTVDGQTAREKRNKLTVLLQADGAPDHVSIAYYDGDPKQSGTLLDVQQIAAMVAGSSYYHESYFVPSTCGTHTLNVAAWSGASPDVTASAITNVTVQPQDYVQSLINATQNATIGDAQLRTSLLALLNTALQSYQQGQTAAAQAILGTYLQQVAGNTSGIDADSVARLTRLSGVVFGCGSSGFLLTALPPFAAATAGTTASYSMALTPVGGFNDVVTLTCSGLPAGATCSLPQPVTLDGQNQSQLVVTITTTSITATAAGIAIPWSLHAGRTRWILFLLFSIVMVAPLYRVRRLRSTMWGFMIMLLLVIGTIGCGGSNFAGGGRNITPTGIYTVTVQGTSGSTSQNAVLTLLVK